MEATNFGSYKISWNPISKNLTRGRIASKKMVVRMMRWDGDDRDQYLGRSVDESMIVLRLRIKEMKMLEMKNEEVPSHWMRLHIESTLEPIDEIGRRLEQQSTLSSSNDGMIFSHEMDYQNNSSPDMLVQCRICHSEDDLSNMEAPCSCCGTLKYAHRNCVQRWCNEKGDTTCEICLQQFTPSYTAPPPAPLFHYGPSPLNFGLDWDISRRGLYNHQFIGIFPHNHEVLGPDFEFSALSSRSLLWCRIVAIIFIFLLVLQHTLPIILILSGAEEYSLPVIMLLVLRIIGMLVPVYLMIKAIIVMQQLHFQVHHSSIQAREENDLGQSLSRAIHIR